MEWIHHVEEAFSGFIGIIQLAFEMIAVFCILLGLVQTLRLAIQLMPQMKLMPQGNSDTPFVLLRIKLGSWLALALEFQLGADILATTVAPSWESLGKLGAIAIIRTFLNYFLNQELVEQVELREKLNEQSQLQSGE
ncbi:MAG: DUF1622 domain-containing protein [Roseofilum sp. SBFL]|uniref:DUF1622 domain-containing protein n=1 Tax=unclassified Roseofilum TaxID=2620099 RepID=UPI001B2A527A|nr:MULTISPECIES: DUF1622 domain-containing protein [unclassified Roseofilum]MBP0013031.1 DUF1622 domain-containing protein [Roseofilum sp. SID3]MBP0025055.1 DUF1622 domain-containing protein [Roseofilum sp. SID2]MBP0037919.1 DUF1622 domain-containing protein [Roseofilum sp. SID1]MBP0043424.1 DUF1622 domain-containing protein [Roseofilum sp. SBFL]